MKLVVLSLLLWSAVVRGELLDLGAKSAELEATAALLDSSAKADRKAQILGSKPLTEAELIQLRMTSNRRNLSKLKKAVAAFREKQAAYQQRFEQREAKLLARTEAKNKALFHASLNKYASVLEVNSKPLRKGIKHLNEISAESRNQYLFVSQKKNHLARSKKV